MANLEPDWQSPFVTRREFLAALGVGLTVGSVSRRAARAVQPTSKPSATFNVLPGRPTASSVTLNVIPFTQDPWFVEWGSDPNSLGRRCDVQRASVEPVNIVLDGAAPSTRYYYRVRTVAGGGAGVSGAKLGVFRTQRRPGESFVFTVSTDSHLNIKRPPRKPEHAFSRAVRLAQNDEPDFHVTLGDEVMTHRRILVPGPGPAADAYLNYRTHYTPIASVAPIFFTLGNHDGEGWIDEAYGFSMALAGWCREARQRYVPNPDATTYPQGGSPHGNYFAWAWGDVLFVVLDPYSYSSTSPRRPEDWTLGPGQLAWLEKLLASSKQKWKVVFQHQLVGGSAFPADYKEVGPYWNYGRGGAIFAKVGEQKRIHELMVKHGGHIVFKGHDHVYADERRDGIRYTTCGRLSGPQPEGPRWATEAGFRELYPEGFDGAWGYLRIAVSSQSVDVRFIGTDGETRGGYTVGQDRPA